MKKLYKFYILLSITAFIFIIRLFYLQLYTHKYKLNALMTTVKKEIIIPDRGFIFDRNGKLLVFNRPVYELVVIPILVEKNLNISEFCNILEISKKTFYDNFKKANSYSKYLPSIFLPIISKEKFAYIQEKLYKYKGFDWVKRSIRNYKVNHSINVLGYLGEVNKKDINKNSNYYKIGDYIGWTGVEKTYENILRGKKGVTYLIRDRNGCIIGNYNNKKNDFKAINGNDITLTIDWELQDYAKNLMYDKRGGIVAINPKNGEILTMVSSPNSDPNLFVGENRDKISNIMKNTIDNPLFDRCTQALYPPASSFKLIIELSALQMGVVNNKTLFTCHNGFRYGNKIIRCRSKIHGVPIGLDTAIAVSCNNYFARVYKKIIEKYPKNLSKGVNEWSKIVKSFGFGNYFFNDLSTGEKGLIPTGNYYNKRYGNKKWNSMTIISNSIGQGEINVTPLQLANLVSVISNKGIYYTPHIIKKIKNKLVNNYNKPHKVKVNKKYFNFIIRGMEKVFSIGTGKSFKHKNINMAGKTGTSQNFIQFRKKTMSLPDHSIFILFAPVKNPKIAISVVIENGGYGSHIAGPIASLIAEKYINKNINRENLEKKIMNYRLNNIYFFVEKKKKFMINYKKFIFIKNNKNKKLQKIYYYIITSINNNILL